MEIRQDVPLAPRTTLKVGGAADFFVTVADDEELRHAIIFAKEKSVPVTILGGGSNVLVSDEGVRGLVIKNDIRGVALEEEGERIIVTAGAGEVFDDIVARTISEAVWGLENLSAIPGSVGATPIQNIGAYGVEIKDCLAWVEALDMHTMELLRLSPEECLFGYRDSLFKKPEGKPYVVTRVAYTLSRRENPVLAYRDLAEQFDAEAHPSIQAIRSAVVDIRSKKFPDWRTVGTAGSYFKNPIISVGEYAALKETYRDMPQYPVTPGRVKVPLGWILEHVCRMRGYRNGAVGTYEGQALVIVNYGTTHARDIEAFAEEIKKSVREKTGIIIEEEVVLIK